MTQRPTEPSDAPREGEARDETFDMHTLVRLTTWGAAALFAVLLAVLVTRSEPGQRRNTEQTLASAGAPPAQATRIQAEPQIAFAKVIDLETETRQLAATMRTLTTDRDHMSSRLATLEQNLDDVTGSVSRVSAAAGKLAPEPLIGPSLLATISAPSTIPAMPLNAPQVSGPRVASTTTASTAAAVPAAPRRTDDAKRLPHGLDIGSATTLDALRMAWSAVKRKHAAEMEGLYPLIGVRELANKRVELRLVIGPMDNSEAASRLCSFLSATGTPCQATVFDGQRLALR